MNIRDFPLLTVRATGAVISSLSASVNSEPIDMGNFVEAIVWLPVTAHAGTTPTLDCKVQYSPDGVTWIDSGDAFTQITTTDGVFFKKLTANFGRWIRLVFTLGGTNPVYTVAPAVQVKS